MAICQRYINFLLQDFLTCKLSAYLVDMENAGPVAGAWQITGVSQNPIPTITTAAPHGLSQGNWIEIFNVSGAALVNGLWIVQSVPGPTSFTVNVGTTPANYTTGGYVWDLRDRPYLSDVLPVAAARLARTDIPTVGRHASDSYAGIPAFDFVGAPAIRAEAILFVRSANLATDPDLPENQQRQIVLKTDRSELQSGLPVTPPGTATGKVHCVENSGHSLIGL